MSHLIPPPEITRQSNAMRDCVQLETSREFVQTDTIRCLIDRALTYLGAGYAVHFAGPAGTGKTTLAFHVATQLGRPVVLLHGDEEFASSDLVGRGTGYRRSRVVDNFIHSVVKTEEQMTATWVDNRLTTACQAGYTLIYDEFNRSRPEANNALLSVLSEGILNLPNRLSGTGYLNVDPQFRAIFTSNPEEYVGVHKAQNALLGRLVTIAVDHPDAATEAAIVAAKSGVPSADAERIVELVRRLRGRDGHTPSLRAAIAVGRALRFRGCTTSDDDLCFIWACRDILGAAPQDISAGRRRKSGR